MATTIKSTELDHQEIKESLKRFFEASGEFNDYDFEGSALNNLLDVLAYNTHYNALTANFALNESFLVTAQLRPSVVSLAESLGYIPDSKKSAEATINFSINLLGAEDLDSQYTIQPGELVLRGVMNGIDYTFTNRTELRGVAENSNYTFSPASNPDEPVFVYEGEERTQDFIVGNAKDVVYVIPDQDIDISTAIVRVFEDQFSSSVDGGSEYAVYTNLVDATTINASSRLYVLRESPNGFYELSFGNGTSLGLAPSPGNVVSVNYLRTSGSAANGIEKLDPVSQISFGDYVVDPDDISTNLKGNTRSAGGADKEGIESIRANAPFQYAAQNRMVTANDYSSLILKKYSSFIEDIQSWGGEDDPEPDYGTVFTSIVWSSGISATTISNTRLSILNLADQYSIASFNLTFVDPVETYLGVDVFFQYNPSLSNFTESTIRSAVGDSVREYFETNTGKFDQVFRLSNMLTEVDATDPSVLSSRAIVTMNRRLVPTLGARGRSNYKIEFPTQLRDPELVDATTVESSLFTFKNKTVFIRNKLDQKTLISSPGVKPEEYKIEPSTQLQLIRKSDGGVEIDNIGSYDKTEGTVTLTGLEVQSIQGSVNYIKIYAIPANQSVVNSVRNNIVKYDLSESFAKAIRVETE
jgi:hypothetical protein